MSKRVYELSTARFDDIGELEDARSSIDIAKDCCLTWGLTEHTDCFQDAYDAFDERITALYEEEEAGELEMRNELNRADGFPPLRRYTI